MKIHIVIPTYNRSAKLERIIKTYSYWKIRPLLHILDSSGAKHLELNKKNCSLYDNVSHQIYSENVGFVDRVIDWLINPDNPDIFFLGNDEDIFFEKYAKFAVNFLMKNPSFSTLIGSYITILKPLWRIIPQVSLKKIIPFNFDLSGTFEEKITTYVYLNCSTKLPPLFYGVRRKYQLLKIYKELKELKVKHSVSELADQLFLIKSGDIKFVPLFMTIRDESRVNYVREKIRQDAESYMAASEIKKLFGSIKGLNKKIYLIFHSIYHPSLRVFSSQFKKSDLLTGYQMTFDIKVFSSNSFISFYYNFFSRLIHKTAFLMNCFLLIPIMARDYYKLFFFINSIIKPLKVNKIYKK